MAALLELPPHVLEVATRCTAATYVLEAAPRCLQVMGDLFELLVDIGFVQPDLALPPSPSTVAAGGAKPADGKGDENGKGGGKGGGKGSDVGGGKGGGKGGDMGGGRSGGNSSDMGGGKGGQRGDFQWGGGDFVGKGGGKGGGSMREAPPQSNSSRYPPASRR